MSALASLLAVVEPLAEPLAEAVVDLVRDALAGEPAHVVAAKAERVATLNAFKIGVEAAARAKREELARGGG